MQNAETSLPLTFAIIRDSRRRGGFRVARARVLLALEIGGAEVREVRGRRQTHWLAFSAMSKRSGAPLRKKFRALLEREKLSGTDLVSGATNVPAGSDAEAKPARELCPAPAMHFCQP